MLKSIINYFNETALMLHEIQCGTYQDPDSHMVCKHCLQHINDPGINHASTGCTVKVKAD